MKKWIVITVLALAALGAAGALSWTAAGDRADAEPLPGMVVYKSPTCGCCSAWIAHVRAAGFEVDSRDVSQRDLVAKKQEAGLRRGQGSCHTAFVGDYAIEGHVPAEDIKRLLATEPDVAGLTVPGMPIGSPGMEQGPRVDPYDVIAFRRDGTTEVFASHPE